MDQCFYLWISIPAVLRSISFISVYLSTHGRRLSFVHYRCSTVLFTVSAWEVFLPGPNNDILAVRWRNITDKAEYPHIAIGHRLSSTKAYENNVLSLDWHGLKNFKDFEEFVNVFFFFFFLSKQLNSTESAGRIYKHIH